MDISSSKSLAGFSNRPFAHSFLCLYNSSVQTCNRLSPSNRVKSSLRTSILTSGYMFAKILRSSLSDSTRSFGKGRDICDTSLAVRKGFVLKASVKVDRGEMVLCRGMISLCSTDLCDGEWRFDAADRRHITLDVCEDDTHSL